MDVKLTDNSEHFRQEMQAAVLRALEQCGLTAENYAKRLCPVDTGDLRNSISHKVAESAVYIGTNSDHGAYVELGTGQYVSGGRSTPWVYRDAKGNWHMTHGQRPQPYLKPAVADHAGTYQDIITKELKG